MVEQIVEAKNLVIAYSDYVKAKDLQKILIALCEDASIQMPVDVSLQGKKDIEAFYKKRFANADYEFNLDFTDEKIVSDLIFINGLMAKSISSEGETENTNWDFSFILKKENAKLKIWQLRVI